MKTGVASIAVLHLALACAPRAAPPLQQAETAAAPVAPASPAPLAPVIDPQKAAWARVVEAAKKERQLMVYSFHLYADVGVKVSQAFSDRTGLRVEVISGPSASLIERVKTERRAGMQIASVQTGAGTLVLLAKQDGLTQKLGDLPELKKEGINRYDPWLDQDGHILSLFQITVSPWINTALVRPGAEPKSWRDLLRAEWKGKIGMMEPDSQPPPNYIFYGLTTRGRIEEAFFRELSKQELKFQPTTRMAAEALARREVPLSFVNSPASTVPFLQEGAPLQAIDMAEGVVTYRSGGVVLYQGAPHPNAAKVFINWLFSQEGQTVFHKYNGTVGFRKDVPNFEPPPAQITPARPIWITLEDELEIARIQRERTLRKILLGG